MRRWRTQVSGKKTPEVINRIEQLLEYDTAGDPTTGLKWSRRTPGKIAAILKEHKIDVSANTVVRLLHRMNYSLLSNSKLLATDFSPDRDQQFEYISLLRDRFRLQRLPIVSVDTKKRELVGNFKNAGHRWERVATAVNDHDFRSDSTGVAIPYGIYDLSANRGFVVIGVSHDTAQFAVASIARWWVREGFNRYQHARKILILADTGGSNGCRLWAWKWQLQLRLCNAFNVEVTIAHYPTGTSKWNPIEHRLFSEISKNWAAQPLVSYECILKFIRTTRTASGLSVSAYLDKTHYPKGISPSPEQIKKMRLYHHQTIPKWNYTIQPNA
jgi:hypothetical protein